MPAIGDRTVNLYTVDRDVTTYSGPTNSVSHKDLVDLRRTLPKKPAVDPLRTNIRFERGFTVPVDSTGTTEKPVTVSIAVTLPPGVTPADAKAYVSDCLVQAATAAGELAISGDIHL